MLLHRQLMHHLRQPRKSALRSRPCGKLSITWSRMQNWRKCWKLRASPSKGIEKFWNGATSDLLYFGIRRPTATAPLPEWPLSWNWRGKRGGWMKLTKKAATRSRHQHQPTLPYYNLTEIPIQLWYLRDRASTSPKIKTVFNNLCSRSSRGKKIYHLRRLALTINKLRLKRMAHAKWLV